MLRSSFQDHQKQSCNFRREHSETPRDEVTLKVRVSLQYLQDQTPSLCMAQISGHFGRAVHPLRCQTSAPTKPKILASETSVLQRVLCGSHSTGLTHTTSQSSSRESVPCYLTYSLWNQCTDTHMLMIVSTQKKMGFSISEPQNEQQQRKEQVWADPDYLKHFQNST